MDSHRQIEDVAASLLAKRDSGDWTGEDQSRLNDWMSAATAHRVAVLRLEAVWDEARRLRALGASLQPGSVPPPGEWKHSPFFDREEPPKPSQIREAARDSQWRFFAASLAAGILLALVSATAWHFWPHDGDRYSTPVGGVASVPLQDGSNVTLNTASLVRIELSTKERHINLDRGEAFFDVAHDPNRPFIVQVGNTRVIAVGTQFSVRRDADHIRVAVTEGKVRIQNGDGVFVTPGGVASLDGSRVVVQEKSVAEVEDELSWRQGYLTFHYRSLAEVVSEFNRYNTHKVMIEDPKIAAIRISGMFRATNYKAFVRVLDAFSIHARDTEETTVLIMSEAQ